MYQSMSLASCGVAFQWSKWSSETSKEKFVLGAAVAPATGTDIDVDTVRGLIRMCMHNVKGAVCMHVYAYYYEGAPSRLPLIHVGLV